MYLEQAAEKAIGAGMDRGAWTNNDALLLKPIFWISLGKALGWPDSTVEQTLNNKAPINSKPVRPFPYTYEWQWHRFIDHLAAGKDANDYFKAILQ